MAYFPSRLVIQTLPPFIEQARRCVYDVFSAAVLLCSAIVSMSYYATVLIERENRLSHYLEVTYDYGFFTLSAAGAFPPVHIDNEIVTLRLNLPLLLSCSGVTALLSTASSLFQRNDSHNRRRSRSHHHTRSRTRSREGHVMLVDSIESPAMPTDLSEPPPPYAP